MNSSDFRSWHILGTLGRASGEEQSEPTGCRVYIEEAPRKLAALAFDIDNRLKKNNRRSRKSQDLGAGIDWYQNDL